MKQLTYWHANLRNANKTELWSGNDNEQDWHDILEKSKINYLNESQKKDLEHYIKNPIKYKLNNYGFRTYDNLEKKDGNVFLGCSFTYGEGHHLENTWSYKLHKKIGGDLKYWNLSQPATGIDFAFRMLYSYRNLINCKNVFLYIPFPRRFEHPVKFNKYEGVNEEVFYHPYHIVAPTFNTNFLVGMTEMSDRESVEHFKNQMYALTREEHIEINYAKNYWSIQRLCKDMGANFYCINPFHDELINVEEDESITPNKARDPHPSVSYQNAVFSLFYKQYINKEEPEVYDFSKHTWKIKRKDIQKFWFEIPNKKLL